MESATWLQRKTGWIGRYRFQEPVEIRRGTPRTGTTVAIPTWNGASLLPACFSALREQCRQPTRILVFDNDSSDDTERVVRAVPHVEYIRLSMNTGYSGAAHRAYQLADTEYLAILNNDARPAPSWLERLEDAVSSDQEAGCAFPLAVMENGSVDTAGDHVTRAGFVYKGGYKLAPIDIKASRGLFVSCPGVAPLYRVSALDAIGGWDRGLHSSLEDVDLSLRLWMAGWEILPVWETRTLHLQGETSAKNIALREFLMSRNEAVVLFKALQWGTLLRLLPAHGIYLTLSLFSHLFRGTFTPYAAGKVAFAWSVPQCLAARRSVLRGRQLAHAQFDGAWLKTWFRLSCLGGRRGPP